MVTVHVTRLQLATQLASKTSNQTSSSKPLQLYSATLSCASTTTNSKSSWSNSTFGVNFRCNKAHVC
jgi:hypothetical protein